MINYKVDLSKKWDYENGFYLTCETGRIGKFLSHLEIYKKIIDLPGSVLEFGVYKGSSFVRLVSFRDLLENSSSRNIVGFDIFGKFPQNLSIDSDKEFVERFENDSGNGISKEELEALLKNKKTSNYELLKGYISETLPSYIKNNPALKISLLHIDVDVYEPTKLILESLWDKIVPGGILMLDDYGTVEGETKAVDEYFENKNISIKKMKYYHTPSYIVKNK